MKGALSLIVLLSAIGTTAVIAVGAGADEPPPPPPTANELKLRNERDTARRYARRLESVVYREVSRAERNERRVRKTRRMVRRALGTSPLGNHWIESAFLCIHGHEGDGTIRTHRSGAACKWIGLFHHGQRSALASVAVRSDAKRRQARYPVLTTRRWRKFRLVILERDRYQCHWCGGRANEVDHLIPHIEGGPLWDPRNVVAACKRCNSKRGAELGNKRRAKDLSVPRGLNRPRRVWVGAISPE